MDFEKARFNMIEQQVRPWDVLDPDVLNLLATVHREDFVPAGRRGLAYADCEIPLGPQAVMLAPRVEARALQALQLKRHEKVLEVGTGSGYMAALLSAHAAQVWTIEIDPALAQQAQANIERAGIVNVEVEIGDGLGGLPAHAPYDVIVLSGAVPAVPHVLLEQLKVGGRLFAIVGTAPAMEAQLITRTGEAAWHTANLFETVTRPLANAPRVPAFSF